MIKTIHGTFTDEEMYNLWCEVNHIKPIKRGRTKEETPTIKIENNYDVNERIRKDD